MLALEAEMTDLRDQANANKEVLKSRTKNMVDQVDSLKDRYENLEKRRKKEAEGYQADVNLLKQKLRTVESQLVRAAVAKTKGKLFMICKANLIFALKQPSRGPTFRFFTAISTGFVYINLKKNNCFSWETILAK